MLDNNFSKNGLQKKEKKGLILVKSILAAIYVVFFGSVAFLASENKLGLVSIVYIFMKANTLFEGTAELFYDSFSPYFFFIFSLIFLLAWSFYRGIETKKKYLFIYPLLGIILLSIIFFFSVNGKEPEVIAINFMMTALVSICYLFFSLITSLFIYFKKEYLLFIIGAIIFVILLVWGVRLAEYSMRTTDPKICETFSLSDSGRLRNICFQELANRTNDINFCSMFYESNKSCIVDFAIRENNPDLCKKVVSTFAKADQDECYGIFAAETKNLELCETLSGWGHIICIESIAIERRDSELCERIEDEYSQNRCREKVSGHY
jgi:hypothetical protein